MGHKRYRKFIKPRARRNCFLFHRPSFDPKSFEKFASGQWMLLFSSRSLGMVSLRGRKNRERERKKKEKESTKRGLRNKRKRKRQWPRFSNGYSFTRVALVNEGLSILESTQLFLRSNKLDVYHDRQREDR